MDAEEYTKEGLDKSHNCEVNHDGIEPVTKLRVLAYEFTNFDYTNDSRKSVKSG